MTINKKMLVTILISVVITSFTLVMVLTQTITPVVRDEAFNKLIVSMQAKRNLLNEYFRERRKDVEAIADSETIQDLMVSVDTPNEEGIGQLLGKMGYYDLLLIDAKSGMIEYTYKKESDYRMSVLSYDLKETGIADIWRKVIRLQRSAVVDMTLYPSSNNEPVMFIGAPVYRNDELNAVVALRLSNEEISNIMNLRDGYGETQEDFLVGADRLLRSDTYLGAAQYSLEPSFKQGLMIDTESVNKVFETMQTGRTINIDYRGKEVMSAYAPIDIDDGLTWAIISKIEMAEAMSVYTRIVTTMIVGIALGGIVHSLLLISMLRRSVIKPFGVFRDNLISFYDFLGQKADSYERKELKKSRDELSNINKAYIQSTDMVVKHLERTKALSYENERVLELYRSVENVSGTYSWLFTIETNTFWCSDNMYRIFELEKTNNPTITYFSQRMEPEDFKSFLKHKEDLETSDFLYKIQTPDGGEKYLLEKYAWTTNEEGLKTYLVTGQEITQKVNEEADRRDLIHKTQHDPLTGVYNREFYNQNIDNIIQNNTNLELETAIGFIDIDHFKEVNDENGHDVGDVVLEQTAATLKSFIRDTDFIIRWGGDEFLVILTLRDGTALEKVLEKYRANIENREYPFIGHATCSIGGAVMRLDEPVSETVKRADEALYRSKEKGRNCVTVFL